MEKKKSPLRSLALALAVLAGLVIYAYGFQVTQVSLEETSDPLRQERFIRILRALAKPDIVAYEKEEFVVEAPIQVPCGDADGALEYSPDTSKPYIVVTPACADPRAEVTIEGFNFEPNTNGPLNFIPPSGVSLKMATIQTDANGHFLIKTDLPKRPSDQTQTVRAVTRRSVGTPHLTENALETWDKIVETVFLALLATTFGVILAVPLSFLAAKNIMLPITSPLTSVALAIIFLPVGFLLGREVGILMSQVSQLFTNNVIINLIGVILVPAIIWFAVRWALPPVEETRPTTAVRIARVMVLVVAGLLGILFLFLISNLAMLAGRLFAASLGSFSFLGTFISSLGELLGFSIILISALIGISIFNNLAGKLGQFIVEKTPASANRVINLVLGALAGAILFALIGAGINWLYQLNNPFYTFTIPAILGAIVGFITATILSRNSTLPIGLTIYMVVRTIFNALRSIESLVMVIVFAVWVGIGPFAGVLALALHTIASNAKLYSEQVESIMSGPIEAITATGANRLQTIIYAVIPQIVPPFISYTMYRWDINVRMSTIIGFAGGGGIGFLLQQNINLLNYRQASAQMLAIAIVVASMDYISSVLRERYV
jgi:phosphonate ABC transporter permease subunit PhnE